jgi:branched-chain amino acid transport system permease protein
MLAVRANERAAAATGVNVAQTKLLAFGISSCIAGIAGTLIAYDQLGGVLAGDKFVPLASVVLLTSVFIGGVSNVAGAILAGVAVTGGYMYYLLAQNIGNFNQWVNVVAGVVLILVAVRQPDGVAGYNIELYRKFKLRQTKNREATTGSPPETVLFHQTPAAAGSRR